MFSSFSIKSRPCRHFDDVCEIHFLIKYVSVVKGSELNPAFG